MLSASESGNKIAGLYSGRLVAASRGTAQLIILAIVKQHAGNHYQHGNQKNFSHGISKSNAGKNE